MASMTDGSPSPHNPQEAERLLLERIDRYLTGRDAFDAFVDAYYYFFVDGVPENTLDESAYRYFAGIQEKLDFASAAPTTEERSDGWISADEFKDWLRVRRSEYRGQVAAEPTGP